jgi:multisubunit Na+/H+ antiporter MnhE subunit
MMKLIRQIYFLLFYLIKVIFAGFSVMMKIILFRKKLYSGMVKLQVKELSSKQKYILFHLITMTPGTMSIEMTNNGQAIVVHLLDISNLKNEMYSMERLKDHLKKI